jgi:hypothetical protein
MSVEKFAEIIAARLNQKGWKALSLNPAAAICGASATMTQGPTA